MRCAAPWTHFIVDINGDVSPCCFYYKSLGNLYQNSLEEIWNGERYADLRRTLLSFQKCADCPIEVFYPPVVEFKKGEFYKNYYVNRYEFKKGEIKLKSFPIFYNITASTLCNLKCSFCCQNKHREEGLGPLSEEIISSFKQYYKFAHILSWIGGETLMQNPFIHFLEEDNSRKYPDMCLKVTTNGTLLNTALFEKLNQFRKTFLIFSIDGGTKEIYEKLRVGASWETVIDNLKKSKNYENIKSTVQYTVMRSNILDLLDAVVLFRGLQVDVSFCPIIGGNLINENIFYYLDLLKGIPWRTSIDWAIGTATGMAKESLIEIKNKLIKSSVIWGENK